MATEGDETVISMFELKTARPRYRRLMSIKHQKFNVNFQKIPCLTIRTSTKRPKFFIEKRFSIKKNYFLDVYRIFKSILFNNFLNSFK